MPKLTMGDVLTPDDPTWQERAQLHKRRGKRCCTCRNQLSMSAVESGDVQCAACIRREEDESDRRLRVWAQKEQEKANRVAEVMETLKPILMDIYAVLEMCVPLNEDCKREVMIKLEQKLENI